jgi:tRNA U34 5-carboxymethylaminomethyl modifying GTPase MnmE/TrmE
MESLGIFNSKIFFCKVPDIRYNFYGNAITAGLGGSAFDMSLNDTPSGERVHIGIFGRRNAGKSSLLNAITGQSLAVVSETAGTTTDPVKKSMEILPIGPVLLIDTPGIDDTGELGEKRVEKTRETLRGTDAAVLVVDAREGKNRDDDELLGL